MARQESLPRITCVVKETLSGKEGPHFSTKYNMDFFLVSSCPGFYIYLRQGVVKTGNELLIFWPPPPKCRCAPQLTTS